MNIYIPYKDIPEDLIQFFEPVQRHPTTWNISPKGTNLDHYAAFPVDLVTPMLKSSISERGVCPSCGKAWARVVERQAGDAGESLDRPKGKAAAAAKQGGQGTPTSTLSISGRNGGWTARGTKRNTIAWHPSCTCGFYPLPKRGLVTCGKCKGTGKEQKWECSERVELSGSSKRWAPGNFRKDGNANAAEPKKTGNPCPACRGTGTVVGDVWPDDVDTWEVAPSVVLDMFCGTGTVGQSLSLLQNQHTEAGQDEVGTIRYPGVFVGLDLKLSYLANLSRERLQIEALEQWQEGIDGNDGKCLDGLPLFEGLNV